MPGSPRRRILINALSVTQGGGLSYVSNLFRELDRDDELLSTGVIASMDLARLATFLERRLGIAIPDRDVGAVHFDSIAKILAYVEARQSE